MSRVNMDPVKHWIDGRQVDSVERCVTTNPATGEAIAEVAAGGEAEINAALEGGASLAMGEVPG